MAASSSLIRSWRTAFLTLRDETLTSPPRTTVNNLLHHLIFSQSETLIAAAPNLPPHEVTSDVVFLLELVRNTSDSEGNGDLIDTFTLSCHLIHYVSRRVSLELNSSSWTLVLDSYGRMMEIYSGKAGTKRVVLGNVSVIRAIKQCLETIKCLISVYQRKCSLSENTKLLNFLLSIVASCHAELFCSSYLSGNMACTAEFGNRIPRYNTLWEVQSVAFTMIGEVFSRVGSSFPLDTWQSTIEVLKKVMDVLASRSLLVEDTVIARFYTSLLHCLHLVLVDPKGSLSDHVAGFVAALRMFFIYGLTKRSQLMCPIAGHKKELTLTSLKLDSVESSKLDCGPYRPPHMRKKGRDNPQQLKTWESSSFSDHESSIIDYTSSDSDYSDSDGSAKDADSICSSKARVAAIVCIQDLCRADPKSFTAQWTMLLPSSDVLQPRKYEATLMTCLLFDPYLKARLASASTLAAMLDGPSSVFLQVAEYKETTKCGSFTALSSSLGHILMQLHTGILYLIQHETHSGLLVSLFKVLILLISSTPYSRMPGELLQTVISSLRARIEEGFLFRSDQTGLQATAINCLTAALSVSPSSLKVRDMFVEELSRGFVETQGMSGVLSTIFRHSEPGTSHAISFEALQALRAVSHNYPNIMDVCWEQVSTIVFGFLRVTSPEVPTWPWKGHVGNPVGSMGEKVITAAVKVLDECLRAISGFKGTEDILDDKLLDTPFTSDNTRTKKISSAPSYGSESPAVIKDKPETCQPGSEQWCVAIEKHLPLVLWHTSAMVRAASVTCFAGITSSVFSSLPNDKQKFIFTSSIRAALNDEVPSVRSAACRAIGVITFFPQISESAEILEKIIHAAEINTRDPLISVRITASWALANACDSLRHCINTFSSKRCSIDSKASSRLTTLLIECALRLTKESDKVKANAVRALGNLSRCVQFTNGSGIHDKLVDSTSLSLITNGAENHSDLGDRHQEHRASNSFQLASLEDSDWLERMVQAFLSCVTTGNVKVQWNVCHALRNLFLNETIKLQDMDWAPSVFSILLLLLRDSSNFKIRIQAAAALAVQATVFDYGRSFPDVVQGVEHILENLSSDSISTSSSFKYRVALENQLTSTMLHVLGLASRSDHLPIKDFLVKKASFLEEWFKVLCSSLGETGTQLGDENSSTSHQKKEVISKAIQSLMEVYEGRNHHAIARRFDKLAAEHESLHVVHFPS